MPRSLVPPLGCSMPGPKNRACTVEMTTGQAALIARAMAVLLLVGEDGRPLSATEREEAEALRDMALELDPDSVNGWCL